MKRKTAWYAQIPETSILVDINQWEIQMFCRVPGGEWGYPGSSMPYEGYTPGQLTRLPVWKLNTFDGLIQGNSAIHGSFQ